MSGHPALPRPVGLLALAGLVLSAAGLAICLAVPAALAGWLAAFAFWSSVPLGALFLLLLTGLVPGPWRLKLRRPGRLALCLMPLAVLAALPVLMGLPALYGWTHVAAGGWRGACLTPAFFILRTLVLLAVAGGLCALILARRATRGVAAAGLITFVLLDTSIAVDWLMSLDLEFHSSVFGLYVLSIQAGIALCMVLLVHLASRGGGQGSGILGALLLTSLLLWGYFAFMQYLISWSDNLPDIAPWYLRRTEGAWGLVACVIGALSLGPAVLLVFAPVRRSPRWLMSLSLAALTARALECAWLVLPGRAAPGTALWVGLLAFAGLGCLDVAGHAAAAAWRGRRAVARPAWREATP